MKATGEGVVSFAGYNPIYGKMIEINHQNGYTTRSAHLSRITTSKGERVKKRTIIGLVGATGRAVGPHIHYELLFKGEVIDPLSGGIIE